MFLKEFWDLLLKLGDYLPHVGLLQMGKHLLRQGQIAKVHLAAEKSKSRV